jgi:uncharacterized membrane protein SpoIIM required for sporulation
MTIGRSAKHAAAVGGRFFGHAAVVAIGFVLMIVGLGLGVTMIMLPAGVVIGLVGAALIVAGIFGRIGSK